MKIYYANQYLTLINHLILTLAVLEIFHKTLRLMQEQAKKETLILISMHVNRYHRCPWNLLYSPRTPIMNFTSALTSRIIQASTFSVRIDNLGTISYFKLIQLYYHATWIKINLTCMAFKPFFPCSIANTTLSFF